MQSIFASCHMCGSLDNEFIMHVVLDDQSLCPLQKVYICTRCGLIYRNPTIPSRSQFKYGASAWDGNPYYLEKSIETCKLLLDFFQNKGKPKIILEIGAGHGHLSMQLVKAFPDALLVICEPSEQCAFILASKLPNALVFPCTLDEISNLSLHPDIVIACGVDYLFHHHRSAINNIYNILNNGGVFYVERNAFTTINKYLGDNRKKITTRLSEIKTA